jgi:hypothetical protein
MSPEGRGGYPLCYFVRRGHTVAMLVSRRFPALIVATRRSISGGTLDERSWRLESHGCTITSETYGPHIHYYTL